MNTDARRRPPRVLRWGPALIAAGIAIGLRACWPEGMPRGGEPEPKDAPRPRPPAAAAAVDEPLVPAAQREAPPSVPLLAVAVRVATEHGVPIPGASVFLRDPDDRGLPAYLLGDTDAEGRLTITRFTHPSEFSFLVREPGFAPEVFLAAPALDPVVHEVILRPARTISGRVVDQHGAAVEGASLWLRDPEDDPDERARQEYPRLRARSGADGTFSIEGAHEGAFELAVDAPGNERFLPDRSTWPARGGEDDVTIRLTRVDGPSCRIVVEVTGVDPEALPGPVLGSIERIRATPDQVPAPPLPLRAVAPTTLERDGLVPGTYRILVEVPGRTARTRVVPIAPGISEQRLDVRIEPEGVILGSVDLRGVTRPDRYYLTADRPFVACDPSGRPDPMRRIGVNGAALWADDRFYLDGVEPGTVSIELIGEGICGRAEVDLRPGARVEVVVRAVEAAALELHFDEPPPLGRYVFLIRRGASEWRTVRRRTVTGILPWWTQRLDLSPGALEWAVWSTRGTFAHDSVYFEIARGQAEVESGRVTRIRIEPPE